MAFLKLGTGEFLLCGVVPKDCEVSQVGKNNSTMAKFAVLAMQKPKADGTKENVWSSCVAWHDVARTCAEIKKGDTALVIGSMETTEKDGKTYKNIVVQFVSVMPKTPKPSPVSNSTDGKGKSGGDPLGDLSEYTEILNDSDLPF